MGNCTKRQLVCCNLPPKCNNLKVAPIQNKDIPLTRFIHICCASRSIIFVCFLYDLADLGIGCLTIQINLNLQESWIISQNKTIMRRECIMLSMCCFYGIPIWQIYNDLITTPQMSTFIFKLISEEGKGVSLSTILFAHFPL